MACIPMCQRCQALHHECYGLPDRVCGCCQRDKRPVKTLWLRVSLFFDFLTVFRIDPMVVDSMPSACRVFWTMAPVKPPTQPRKVAPKGKAVPHPTMRPCVHKVTQIVTLMPEVAKAEAPPPPIAVPSQASHSPLFEEAFGLGDEQVGKGAPTSSGKCSLGLSVRFTDCGCHSFWHACPVEAQGRQDHSQFSSPPLSTFPSLSALPTPSSRQMPSS